MDAKKGTPEAVRGKSGDQPGQGKTDYLKDTTAWCLRQFLKIALPWVAVIVISTRYTNRKSLFLDRLIIIAEGGGDDTQF
jgi:hypothetical protein